MYFILMCILYILCIMNINEILLMKKTEKTKIISNTL